MSDVSAELRACAEALREVAHLYHNDSHRRDRAYRRDDLGGCVSSVCATSRAALALPAVQAALAGEGTPSEAPDALARAREIRVAIMDKLARHALGEYDDTVPAAPGDLMASLDTLIAAALTAATRRT